VFIDEPLLLRMIEILEMTLIGIVLMIVAVNFWLEKTFFVALLFLFFFNFIIFGLLLLEVLFFLFNHLFESLINWSIPNFKQKLLTMLVNFGFILYLRV